MKEDLFVAAMHQCRVLDIVCFFVCSFVLHVTPDSLGLDNWGTRHRCWRWDLIVEQRNFVYRRNTPLALGGTRTQVLAHSLTIAASALNHCAITIIG